MHKLEMQHKKKVPIYDMTRAEVDEIIYGVDLDPRSFSAEEVERLQGGAAGKTSVTKELEIRSESKKMVPHEWGSAVNLLFPLNEGTQTTKKSEVVGNAEWAAWQAQEGANGNNSVHVAHLRHREIEYVDNAEGSRKARGSPKPAEGAAGKKVGVEGTLMQAKAKPGASAGGMPGKRAYGKPSGLKDVDGGGVAAAMSSNVYEQALAAGREMISTPYTEALATSTPSPTELARDAVQGSVKSRTGYTPPAYGGDSAGNFRKENLLKQAKPRPEAITSAPPFGVDPVNHVQNQSRFTTSASSIGRKQKLEIMPYATATVPPTASPLQQTAIVPAAGMRPRSAGKR